MGTLACTGAVLTCTMGAAPSTLMVLPINRVFATTPIAMITKTTKNTKKPKHFLNTF